MISLLLAIALFQSPNGPKSPGGLLPGSGIVTGSIHFAGGGPAAGVRVGAVPIDDPSSLVSVGETDSSGRYRLINIPAGKYFIVAGRLDNLTYFPGSTERTNATGITIEAAKVMPIADFAVPAGSKRPVAPSFSAPGADPGLAAYREISAQKNPAAKQKLLLSFEKQFPKSSRLAEVYIDLSRLLAAQSDFRSADDYAEKAVAVVSRLKAETPADYDQAWHHWLAALETSARDNLTWTRQLVAWQQKQLNATILRSRP